MATPASPPEGLPVEGEAPDQGRSAPLHPQRSYNHFFVHKADPVPVPGVRPLAPGHDSDRPRSDVDFKPAEADQPTGETPVASGPMRGSGDSITPAGRVPGRVALGQGPEDTPAPLDPRIVQALRLIDQARDLLWQVAQASPMTGTATDRVGIALQAVSTASVTELMASTGLARENVQTGLVRLGAKARRIGRGVYAWVDPTAPHPLEEETEPPAAPPPSPPPAESPRMAAKLAREAEISRLSGQIAPQRPAAAAILRPYVDKDDSEPDDRLRQGLPVEPEQPLDRPPMQVQGEPYIPDIPVEYQVVAWDPAWGPEPKKKGA